MVQPRSHTQVLSGFALLFLLLLSHFLEERSTATPPQPKHTPDDYEQFLEGILDTPTTPALVARSTKEPRVWLDVIQIETRSGLVRQLVAQLLHGTAVADGRTKEELSVSYPAANCQIGTQIFKCLLPLLNKAGLVSSQTEPQLVTLSGRQASICSTWSKEVPQYSGPGSVGVQLEHFGTRIDCLPTVQADGSLRLELGVGYSVSDTAFGIPTTGATAQEWNMNRAQTTIDLKPGETGCLGGLVVRSQSTSSVSALLKGFPLVGPVLSKLCLYDEIEMVILVTPTIHTAEE